MSGFRIASTRTDRLTRFTPTGPLAAVVARAREDPLLWPLLRHAWANGCTVERYLTRHLRPRPARAYYRRMRRLGDDSDRFLFLRAFPGPPDAGSPVQPD